MPKHRCSALSLNAWWCVRNLHGVGGQTQDLRLVPFCSGILGQGTYPKVSEVAVGACARKLTPPFILKSEQEMSPLVLTDTTLEEMG